MKKRFIAAAMAVTAAFSLAACGKQMSTNPNGDAAADTKETADGDNGELVLFTWENMFPQEVLDGFTEKTGIKVIYSNFDTDETMLEKLSQAKGGDYDLIVADDYIIEQAVNEGLVQEIDKSIVTNSEILIRFIRDSSMIKKINTQYLMVPVFL